MKLNLLLMMASAILTVMMSQTAEAQTAKNIPTREASLIAYLVEESKQPGFSSEGDVYLAVKIGRIEYTAELKTGKIVKQKKVKANGGICSDYAVVKVRHLDENGRVTSQGSGQIFKLAAGKWETIALAEGDYACAKLADLPEAVVKCLKIKCF